MFFFNPSLDYKVSVILANLQGEDGLAQNQLSSCDAQTKNLFSYLILTILEKSQASFSVSILCIFIYAFILTKYGHRWFVHLFWAVIRP